MPTTWVKILKKSVIFTLQNSRFWIYGAAFGLTLESLVLIGAHILPLPHTLSFYLENLFILRVNGKIVFAIILGLISIFLFSFFASWVKTLLVLQLQFWLAKKNIFFSNPADFRVPALASIEGVPSFKDFVQIAKGCVLKNFAAQIFLFFIFFSAVSLLLLPFLFWLKSIPFSDPIVFLTMVLGGGLIIGGALLRRFTIYFICLYKANILGAINAAAELIFLVKWHTVNLLLFLGLIYGVLTALGAKILMWIMLFNNSLGVSLGLCLGILLFVFYSIVFVFTETFLLIFFNNLVRPLEYKPKEEEFTVNQVSDARQG